MSKGFLNSAQMKYKHYFRTFFSHEDLLKTFFIHHLTEICILINIKWWCDVVISMFEVYCFHLKPVKSTLFMNHKLPNQCLLKHRVKEREEPPLFSLLHEWSIALGQIVCSPVAFLVSPWKKQKIFCNTMLEGKLRNSR